MIVYLNWIYYSNNYDFVPFALPSRYRPVTVPLPLQRYRDRPSATVTYRYWPLPTVSHRYRTLHALPNVTSVTERYITLLNVTSVTSVTERYRTLQALPNVTDRYKRYIFYLTKNFKWTVLKLIYYLSINLSLIKNFSS